MQTAERFWAKVEKTDDGCWLWTSNRTPAGYPTFRVSRERPTVYAHRFVYELEVGPIPQGLTIDHLCRNRGCVNPAHLEAVTQGENVRRAVAFGSFGQANRAKTHCPQGHPYTPENTNLYRGQRYCRACNGKRLAATA